MVRYVGRGDVHDRIKTHSGTPGKYHLTPFIVWEHSLTWYEMKGLEQALMDLYGGSRSDSWQTPLQNEVRSYSRTNAERCFYQSAPRTSCGSVRCRRFLQIHGWRPQLVLDRIRGS